MRLVDNVSRGWRATCLLAVAVFLAAASAAYAGGTVGGAQAARTGVERVQFVDYGKPATQNAQTAATDAATDFNLLGARWPANSTINYSVSTNGCTDGTNDCNGHAAASAVDLAFDTWQVSGLTYNHSNTGDLDPCGGNDSVSWTPIDGPGGILASTSVCRTLGKSKEIVGFQTVFDSGDPWSDSGALGKFDIQAVATHEEGHTTGLDHVHSPRDARLTMYPYITEGDTGFQTLGCGDRLGLNMLYNAGLNCSNPPLPND